MTAIAGRASSLGRDPAGWRVPLVLVAQVAGGGTDARAEAGWRIQRLWEEKRHHLLFAGEHQ